MSKRTKPMLIAPLIPMMGFLGILGLDEFHGTRWIHLVIGVWCAVMLAMTVYVVRRMMQAKRLQRGTQ